MTQGILAKEEQNRQRKKSKGCHYQSNAPIGQKEEDQHP